MINDSRLDNFNDCQVEASFSGDYIKEVEVRERRLFGFVIRRAGKKKVTTHIDVSTTKGDIVPDDVKACRKFQYRCGLVKAINVFSDKKSTMTIYLDGLPNVTLSVEKTEFRFDPKLENGPIAEIIYHERCTRWSQWNKMSNDRVSVFAFLVFKDRDQMKKFIVATAVKPENVNNSSDHRSPDSDSSWPLAAIFVAASS